MKKLLYIANLRLPTEKAYGIQITKMCEAFANSGMDLELVIPSRPNPSGKSIFEYYGVKKNFRVRIMPTPDFYWPGKLDKISFLIKNFISGSALFFYALSADADIIYSRDELPLYLLSFFRKNLVFEAHKFSSSRSMFYAQFKRVGLKIITISGGLKDEFVKFGFNPEKVLVAHDGVDLEEFNISESREECRQKLGLPLDKKIIGYVGQLKTMGMEKGINDLIGAVELLSDNHPDLLLAIVGGSRDDILEYKEFADRKGISDKVLFLGRKDHSDIPYFLRSFDILTMPFPNNKHYAQYMSPLKMFEYMASGSPIVTTDLPTIREVLNEESAVLVKPDEPDALASGIKKILSNADFASKISWQAKTDAHKYSWDFRANSIIKFIEISTA